MIKLADRLKQVQSSSTIRLDAQAKALLAAGKDVINLTAGELDLPPHPEVLAAAAAAVSLNHCYSPVAGLPQLRQAITQYLVNRHHLRYSTDQILVTNGVKQALYSCFQALVQPQAEVIVLLPAWVSYSEQIKLAGGKPVIVQTTADFQIDVTAIAKAITSKTIGLIMNYPNNPTGAIYPNSTLKQVAELAQRHQLWVISDEVYEQLVYSNEPYTSFAHFLPDSTMIVNGVSKSGALTGWRLGFVAGPQPLIKKLVDLQSHLSGNVANVVQYTGIAALQVAEITGQQFRQHLQKRRQLVLDWITGEKRLRATPPAGAFYYFIDIRKVTADADEFCERLLNQFGVALVSGTCFGFNGYVRLSFAQNIHLLCQALERFSRCLDSY